MKDSDLDDSVLVDVVTWVLYLGWLAGLASIVVWLDVVPPLRTIVESFDEPWKGQVAAMATTVAVFVGVRFALAALRKAPATPPE